MRYLWIVPGLLFGGASFASGLWLWFLYWHLLSGLIGKFAAIIVALITPFGIVVVPFFTDESEFGPDEFLPYSQTTWCIMLGISIGCGLASKWCLMRPWGR